MLRINQAVSGVFFNGKLIDKGNSYEEYGKQLLKEELGFDRNDFDRFERVIDKSRKIAAKKLPIDDKVLFKIEKSNDKYEKPYISLQYLPGIESGKSGLKPIRTDLQIAASKFYSTYKNMPKFISKLAEFANLAKTH